MYIPSGTFQDLVANEKFGVWAELYDDEKVALIVKIPASVIKVVADGCKLELIVGFVYLEQDAACLCMALNVHDTVDSPLLVVIPPRFDIEKEGILSLLLKKSVTIVLYNELNHSVCSGYGRLEEGLQAWSEAVFRDGTEIVFPTSSEMANSVIDSFSFKINEAYQTRNIYKANIFIVDVHVDSYDPLLFLSHETDTSISYHPTSGDAGLTQEEQIAHVFKYQLGIDVYHSPEVQIGKKRREFTDVLAYSKDICHLIESKAIAGGSGEVTIARKRSKALKSAKKAIAQLEGGMKAVRRSESVFNSEGVELEINSDAVLHGVVLVSEFYELMLDDEWADVVEVLYQVNSDTQGMVHVMDTSEFYYILKISKGSHDAFNAGMLKRFNIFFENGRLDIKSIDSSLPYL